MIIQKISKSLLLVFFIPIQAISGEWQPIAITNDNLYGNVVECNAATLLNDGSSASMTCYYKESFSSLMDPHYFKAEFRFSPYGYKETSYIQGSDSKLYLSQDQNNWSTGEFGSGESNKILAAIMERATPDIFSQNDGNCQDDDIMNDSDDWIFYRVSDEGDSSFIRYRNNGSEYEAVVLSQFSSPLGSYKNTGKTDLYGIQIHETAISESGDKYLKMKIYSIDCSGMKKSLGGATLAEVIPETIDEIIWNKLVRMNSKIAQ